MTREDVARLVGGERADLIFTDPPYNVPIDRNVCGLGTIRHREFAFASGEMTQGNIGSNVTISPSVKSVSDGSKVLNSGRSTRSGSGRRSTRPRTEMSRYPPRFRTRMTSSLTTRRGFRSKARSMRTT
jgi:hypothetical protein